MPVNDFDPIGPDVTTASGYSQAIQNASPWGSLAFKDRRDVIHNIQEQSFNASEAQKQRDFELYLSNTQYSRAVEDMKKAGLNPASLTAGGVSSGGSTPSGAAASTSNKSTPKTGTAAALIGQFFLSLMKIAATAG